MLSNLVGAVWFLQYTFKGTEQSTKLGNEKDNLQNIGRVQVFNSTSLPQTDELVGTTKYTLVQSHISIYIKVQIFSTSKPRNRDSFTKCPVQKDEHEALVEKCVTKTK